MRRTGRFAIAVAAAAAAAAVSVTAADALNAHASSRAVCPAAELASARCHADVVTDKQGNPLATTSPTGYGPAQFQTAYGLTAAAAAPSSQTIAIAYDDPRAANDLALYSSTYGVPCNGCFKKVNQSGGTKYPRANQGWALEISLDVQIAHATCPNCKILLVEASSNSFSNLLSAEDYATAHANVVSNSWGSSEFSGETSYDGHFNHLGVPITVSAGDSGYGPQYPAASQYVTAVGGTTLALNANNTRASETAWSGTGSGCSAFEPKPSWQKDTGCARRTLNDVSADADPNTGAAVYDSYGYSGQSGWFQVGGTSLASPLVASVFAQGPAFPNIYSAQYIWGQSAGTYFDVTSGSNGSCSVLQWCNARPGWDGPTGFGTPLSTNGF
jgi:subtilase family serine protease